MAEFTLYTVHCTVMEFLRMTLADHDIDPLLQ